MIVIFNKIVLSIFEFKSVSFIMFCQSLFTIFVFLVKGQKVSKPKYGILKPCTLSVANVFFGITAAGALNVAMFSALRRLSIFMTLIGQWYTLNKRPEYNVIISVTFMVIGALIAAADDLSFNFIGYFNVIIANILTASSQVETKKSLNQGWTKTDILFWSACLSLVVFGMNLTQFDPNSFNAWDNGAFRIAFVASMCLGFVINYGASWTIEMNDALTLAVAGSTKSAIMGLIVCAGLFDNSYIFTWTNFLGLQISAISSLFYVYYMHKKTSNITDSIDPERIKQVVEQLIEIQDSIDNGQPKCAKETPSKDIQDKQIAQKSEETPEEMC